MPTYLYSMNTVITSPFTQSVNLLVTKMTAGPIFYVKFTGAFP